MAFELQTEVSHKPNLTSGVAVQLNISSAHRCQTATAGFTGKVRSTAFGREIGVFWSSAMRRKLIWCTPRKKGVHLYSQGVCHSCLNKHGTENIWVVLNSTQDFCSTSLTSGSISPGAALPVEPWKAGNAERHLPCEKTVAESFAEQTCGSWDADGVLLPARPWACCTIPPCTLLLPAGKRNTKQGTPEWCFLCDGL